MKLVDLPITVRVLMVRPYMKGDVKKRQLTLKLILNASIGQYIKSIVVCSVSGQRSAYEILYICLFYISGSTSCYYA